MSSSSVSSDSVEVPIKNDIDLENKIVSPVHSKKELTIKPSKDADITLNFMLKNDVNVREITPEEDTKLTRKLYIYVALITWINLVFFMDKITMAYAGTFGFFEAIGVESGVDRYDTMNTLYYVGYILGQINLLWAQRVGIRRTMIILAFFWNLLMFLTCTLHSYQGAYALRFFLGFVESIAMTLENITLQQLFPPIQKARIGQIFILAALACQIPISFIAYGLLVGPTTAIPVWKIFVIIIGCLTTVTLLLIIWLYPSNPTDLRFLTVEEKVWTIRKVQRSTGASLGSKVFKKYQAIEAVKDPVTWYYVGAMFSLMLCNNITYIENIIFVDIGLTSTLNSFIVTAVGGAFTVVCGIITFFLMKFYPRVWNNTFTAIFWALFSLVPSILMLALPWDINKKVFLALILASTVFGCSWINIVSANQSTCAGYTKMLVRTGLSMAAYSVANIIASRIYYDAGAPRYYVAWGIQTGGFLFTAIFMALAYYVLKRRNKERLAAIALEDDENEEQLGLVETDGGEKQEVNLANLDLTDLENKRFIYPI
ncbi:hypothetical protein ACO0SA_000552 [Hanseniaspora valbyensis]